MSTSILECSTMSEPGFDPTAGSLSMFTSTSPMHAALSEKVDLLALHGFDCPLPPSQTATPPQPENDYSACQTEPGHDASGVISVSISNTFYPGANLLPIPSDLLLMSSDNVFFYVHLTQILATSTNQFNHIMGTDRIEFERAHLRDSLGRVIAVKESAPALNIVLHCSYNMSTAQYLPDLDVLVAAVDALPVYGLAAKKYIAPEGALYRLILAQAPAQPLKVYALASRHDLYELAKPASSHLLTFALDSISDDLASTIDAVYHKRLFALHMGRLAVLKGLLLPALYPHAATEECTFAEQRRLARAWTLTTSYLAWDSRPDVTPQTIGNVCASLSPFLSCSLCKKSLEVRIKELVSQWSFAQRTID